MSFYAVTIPFYPKPKASIRLGMQHYYNPSARGMKATRDYVEQQMRKDDIPMLTGPLFVIAHFRIPVPPSLSCAKRAEQHGLPHIKRPDGDNLEKYLNDALNGVLWEDDARIAWMLRSKTLTYDEKGSTTVYVKPLYNARADYSDMLDFIRQCMDCNDDSDITLA